MIKQFIVKLLNVPVSNETKQIEVAQLWEVRWWSRNGWSMSEDNPSHVSCRQEVETFLTAREAEAFATSLRNAFDILKYTGSGRKVFVTKAKS